MPLADTHSIRFQRRDVQLVGVYYTAQTDAAAPFALFLHGLPGSEKNHDLAQFLRSKGWHVLVLHFAGTWGSRGSYSFVGQIADARAALDFALSASAPVIIDPQKITVLGYSMGSRAALFAAAEDARIQRVVSIAGFSDFSESMLSHEFLGSAAPFLQDVTPSTLGKQFLALGDGPQPMDAVRQIAPRPVLIIHSPEDEMVPFYHAENFSTASSGHVVRADIQGATHMFAHHRAKLIDAVWDFLKDWSE